MKRDAGSVKKTGIQVSRLFNKGGVLTTAIALALSLVVAPPVLAQDAGVNRAEVGAQPQQAYQFDIPAKPLPQAIADLSAVTGLQVLYTEQSTFDYIAPTLLGSYTVRDAMQQLLAGSGLVMRYTGENSVTIELASQEGVQMLPPVRILADGLGLGAVTEDTDSYTIGSTNTATKLNLTPRQTPQIVNAVTHQMIQDFGMTEMEDVLSLAPGVSVGHADDDRRTFTARGYAMSVQYDGLPSTSGIDGGVVAGPDSALIDRTEVLLGAAGLMNGAGQPGGVINMVFKRPTKEFRGAATLAAGSWEKQRIMADLSGSLSESGGLRGRVVAVDQSGESFRDYEKESKKVFYVVVESDLTESTLLSLSIQNQDIYDNVTDRSGLPTDNDGRDMGWSRSTFLAPAWNQWNKYATTYKVRLQQDIFANWQLTVQGSALTSEADWLFGALSSFDSTTGDATFSRWGQYNKETSDDLEVFSTGSVTLFGRSHEIVLGGNWTKRVWDGKSGDGTDYATNLYAFDPETSIPRPILVLDSPYNDQITEQYGGYLAGNFNFTDRVSVVMGARLSWYRYEFGDTAREEDKVFTPYAGVTYELNDWASAYASYTEIFNPQSARGTDGNTLEPEIGVSHELGVKGEFFEGKLNASAVLFRIQKDNEATLLQPYDANNICGGWCYQAKGKTTTEGIDLGLSGQITESIQVMAGVTQYEKDDNNETVNIAKLSGSYAPIGQRWSAGLSIDSSSKSYGQWGMTQEARTLVGVFGKYQLTPSVHIALNGYNLLDEKYYANAIDSGYGRQYWGEPRSWMLTVRTQW
ncbi:MAG: outer membrane receptor for ferric coprogen and ferric-rhodotorulic acid [Porticoccus sp.]|jgi:outer membrane receptor for ferric coprogen and ferric-rhodotorulic acid|uniref:TonB-dependent siderophore receptor n=1 Tax=Porticoccus sp. TaxID=2024853 RepID=UPI0039E64069|tara:strand:- start:99193 stop:101610 length:2418 start_codon:yes stop_codon:yes gene_type:complete